MNFHELLFFSVFVIAIVGVLLLDLGVFDRRNHNIPFREALIYTLVWIAVSLGFYVLLRFHGNWIHMGGGGSREEITALIQRYGHPIQVSALADSAALNVYNHNLALEFLTGYLIEKALSVDNIFVMVMVFMAYGVEPKYYRRVLLWGILAAIVLRFVFIFSASALIRRFDWILYLFGAFLLITGLQMFLSRNKKEKIDVATHPVVRFASRHFRVHPVFVRSHFFIRKNGKWFLTPLFIVLMVIEFSDLIFATDSIPAIFSVTKDPYIVFFSNVFAILGLRAMFFMLVNVIELFRYLKTGLAVLLVFIGIKMLVPHSLFVIPTAVSLYVILGILAISILISILYPERKESV